MFTIAGDARLLLGVGRQPAMVLSVQFAPLFHSVIQMGRCVLFQMFSRKLYICDAQPAASAGLWL